MPVKTSRLKTAPSLFTRTWSPPPTTPCSTSQFCLRYNRNRKSKTLTLILYVTLQVRYKLAPMIWKRLYNIERARYTGGAGALNLLLGRGSMLIPWPSSLTMILWIACLACVHTAMLSEFLIAAPSLGGARHFISRPEGAR